MKEKHNELVKRIAALNTVSKQAIDELKKD